MWKKLKKLSNAPLTRAALEVVREDESISTDIKEILQRWHRDISSLFSGLRDNPEFAFDEKFYEEIDGKTAFSCLQCHLEYFPANYVPGNKIAKYCLCRWHLGVTRCKKCNKDLCGLGTIRVHRKTCLALS